jgi:hypothetical protein
VPFSFYPPVIPFYTVHFCQLMIAISIKKYYNFYIFFIAVVCVICFSCADNSNSEKQRDVI